MIDRVAVSKLLKNKRAWGVGIALLLILLVWTIWPTGKPPERCPGMIYRPGQLIQDFDPKTRQLAPFVIAPNCKPGDTPATPGEIMAAQKLMATWQAYEQRNAEGTPNRGSGGLGFWVSLMTWQPGPIATALLVLALVVVVFWFLILLYLATAFALGFVVVAILNWRYALTGILFAPFLFWWKVLLTAPARLSQQLTELVIAKDTTLKLQGRTKPLFMYLLGKTDKLPSDGGLGDLGSARFATAREIAQTASESAKGATLNIGKLGDNALSWRTDKHVLIVAGSRSGKGRDIIIPNLLRYEGSAFVIDPKGENYLRTASYRQTLGNVCAIDPWNVTKQSASNRWRFNPLALLSKDNPESVDMADVLAHGLVLPGGGGDTHWSDSARALWRALLLHVATADQFEGARDLITARQILLADFLPAKKESGDTSQTTPSTIEGMIANPAFDGVISDFALSLFATPPEERGSIISNAARQTDFLDTPALRASLSAKSEGKAIDFSEWRRGCMSCFVCIPADKLEGSGLRWVRIIVGAALNEMLRELNPPTLPVQFILDELASLKRMEQVERAIGLAAGYGVQVWAIWQDIAQMKDLYQSRWSSFVGNAGVRYVFGIGDHDTAKYFSDYLGVSTNLVTSQQLNAFGTGVSGTGRSAQSRPLMTPDEIMVIDKKEMLVLLDGKRPLITNRVAWHDDPLTQSRATDIEN